MHMEEIAVHVALEASQAPDWGHLPAVAVQVGGCNVQHLLLLQLLLAVLMPMLWLMTQHARQHQRQALLVCTQMLSTSLQIAACRHWASAAVLQAVLSCGRCAAAGTTHWPHSLQTCSLDLAAPGMALPMPWKRMVTQQQLPQPSSGWQQCGGLFLLPACCMSQRPAHVTTQRPILRWVLQLPCSLRGHTQLGACSRVNETATYGRPCCTAVAAAEAVVPQML